LPFGSQRFKVVYLVGDIPFPEKPDCDFLIVQDLYLPPFKVDAFLPAASFAEAGGTLVNMEGRVQEIVQAENPPEGALSGFMRPDWRIFADLANALNCRMLNYKSSADVFKDIRRAVPDFPPGASRRPRRMSSGSPFRAEKPTPGDAASGDFLLVAQPGGYRHRGVDISAQVAGLKELGLEEGIRMNPEDLAALGLKDGDRLTVSYDHGKISASAIVKGDGGCPKKVIYYTRPVVFGGGKDPCDLGPFFGLKLNPVRVTVAREEV
ncbi:MAG: molybdopterin-dependent oxidoreductase, partial [Candidatus Aminicenantes bacterium]|nr:molybdopterin-dependent oxidoreductase [Candidatus Aminicenantes bacterium]